MVNTPEQPIHQTVYAYQSPPYTTKYADEKKEGLFQLPVIAVGNMVALTKLCDRLLAMLPIADQLLSLLVCSSCFFIIRLPWNNTEILPLH
ncbi:MAG: hypothetical protein ACI8R9_002790 [Paraglaciecola sp.]|jgi:hypothetical protein